MNLSCTHCGKVFTITAEQLGTRGKCPHCKATIILPRAATQLTVEGELACPSLWMERWFSVLGALFLHVLILVILALIPYRYSAIGEANEGIVVEIGQLNSLTLTETDEHQLQQEEISANSDARSIESFSLEMISPSSAEAPLDQDFDTELLSPDGRRSRQVGLKSQTVKKEVMGDQNFEELLSQLKQVGLEIVITFDSTGSMEGELQEVKNKIERMGAVLFRMIPKTRISVCTYRDVGAKYVVKGIRLTDNLGDVVNFLEQISAAGGGDDPEAVDAGLNWAIKQNRFRSQARKVILLFGDAPPHAADKDTCLRLASEFRRQHRGIVSTVTCHSDQRLASFVEIAQMGGGEAFLTRNEREIMTQLIILVFGSKHRDKVLEAFRLLDR